MVAARPRRHPRCCFARQNNGSNKLSAELLQHQAYAMYAAPYLYSVAIPTCFVYVYVG